MGKKLKESMRGFGEGEATFILDFAKEDEWVVTKRSLA